jgi:hypothetical protein
MKIQTLFMIICLLLVAPFIGGDDTPPIGSDIAGGETEIPAAHSMYRVQRAARRKGRGTATPATTPTNTAFIRRQKCLFTKEDIISNSPEATLNKSTGRIKSVLPSSPPKTMSRYAGPLAYCVRVMLKACEPSLSKRQIRKLVKPLFPSHRRLNRDMRRAERKGESSQRVQDSYYFCQQALYTTLQHWTFAGPVVKQEALENKLYAERKELNGTLQSLGGYKSLSDKRHLHKKLPQYDTQPLMDEINKATKRLDKVHSICENVEVIDKKVAPQLCMVLHKSPDNFLGQKASKLLDYFDSGLIDFIKPLQAEIKNRNEAEAEAWTTCDLVVNHKAAEPTVLFHRLQEVNSILDNIDDTSVTNYSPINNHWIALDAYNEVEPWKDYPTAKALVETQYIETQLPFAYISESERKKEKPKVETFFPSNPWAFFAHPEIASSHLSPEGLRNALGNSRFEESETSVCIQRGWNKKEGTFTTVKELMQESFESLADLNKNAGLSIISNTKDDNNRSLTKEELVTQWLDSSITLETPNGVERELGCFWNDFMSEGTWFNTRFKSELYSFKAPTKEDAAQTELLAKFAELRNKRSF